MKLEPQLLLSLQSLATKHGGVFTIHDLQNLFCTRSTVDLQQKLRPFLKEKILFKFSRGFYVMSDFNLEMLSQHLCPNSAISLGSVLAKEMIIGSIPKKTVYAVKIGKTRIYTSPLGKVVHLGYSRAKAAKKMWFGYGNYKNNINYADKEKAFLDTLYFYQLGHRFSFNIYSDMQISKLDQKKLRRYLKNYKNPKFLKFVSGVLRYG